MCFFSLKQLKGRGGKKINFVEVFYYKQQQQQKKHMYSSIIKCGTEVLCICLIILPYLDSWTQIDEIPSCSVLF